MWIVFQLLAICGVVLAHTINRWGGLNGLEMYKIWIINAIIQISIAPLFIQSYKLAPSFLQPWFIGTLAICLFGFLISVLFFAEPILLKRIIGIFCSLIAMILLVI